VRLRGRESNLSKSSGELEHSVELLRRELAEVRAQQAATSEILNVISRSAFDLDAVLKTLISSAIALCDAARGVIWLQRGKQLFLAAHVGYATEWVTFAEANPITPAADARTTSNASEAYIADVSLAAFTGEVVNVEDVLHDPRFRSLAAHAFGNYRAGVAVPLKRDGRVEGVISLSRPEAQLFTDRQVALVQTFADQAVIAIENFRLLEEVRAHNLALTESLEQQTATSEILRVISGSPTDVQPVFNAIAESAARLCNAQFSFVHAFDGELLHFKAHYGLSAKALEAVHRIHPLKLGRGTAASRSIMSGEVVQIPDMRSDPDYAMPDLSEALSSSSTMAVPMLRDGVPIGSIAIDRAETGHFPERQINLLKTFADQAVIAVENARLFDEVQVRNR
jgi:two-component system NtrC family sensor kinase